MSPVHQLDAITALPELGALFESQGNASLRSQSLWLTLLTGTDNNLQLEDFGLLYKSSITYGHPGLDWALIEITQPKFKTVSAISTINRAYRKVSLGLRPSETEVSVITASSGILRGKLSPTPTYMRLPPSEKFQEAWIVRLEGKLGETSNDDPGLHELSNYSKGRLWNPGC